MRRSIISGLVSLTMLASTTFGSGKSPLDNYNISPEMRERIEQEAKEGKYWFVQIPHPDTERCPNCELQQAVGTDIYLEKNFGKKEIRLLNYPITGFYMSSQPCEDEGNFSAGFSLDAPIVKEIERRYGFIQGPQKVILKDVPKKGWEMGVERKGGELQIRILSVGEREEEFLTQVESEYRYHHCEE